MGVNEDFEINSKLNLEIFQKIFEKFEPEIQITAFDEAQGSGRGDNYTATLYRIHLTGYCNSSADEKKLKWEKTVICKRLPENVARREAYKSVQLFRNEVEFYTTIMPKLIEFQKTKTNEIVFKAIPRCYLAQNDLLIMEDLRIRGFKMPDRKKGLTIDQTQAVLKEIAIMHSLSLAFKFQNQKQFDKLRHLIFEGIFCPSNESWYKNYYKQLTRNAIEMVSEVLPKKSKYIDKLKEFAGSSTFFARMIELVGKESPLSVICHGDCWTNNFLYRYDDDGRIIETSLVDFQLIRYGSVALDVSNLIFCCTNKKMRDEHLQTLLKLYLSELFKNLKLLGPLPDFCDTEEKCEKQFEIEMKTYSKFALGSAMDIIPISTCSSEDAPDLYIERSEETTGAPELNFPPNDLCRQKMTDILIDLVDGGML